MPSVACGFCAFAFQRPEELFNRLLRNTYEKCGTIPTYEISEASTPNELATESCNSVMPSAATKRAEETRLNVQMEFNEVAF